MIHDVRTPWRAFAPLSLAALCLFAVVVIFGCSGGPKPAGNGAASSPGGGKVWHPATPDTLGPVVAIVAGRKVTRHEVDSLIATAPTGIQTQLRQPEGYRDVVERIVIQEAMVDAALRAGLDKDSTYLAQLQTTSRDLLRRRYYDWKFQALPAIPDSTLEAYYHAHPEEFEIRARARVRHIALPTKAKAQQVRQALVKGALWDQTCAKYSTDKATKNDGGLLGWVAKETDIVPGIGKAPAIVAAAYSLPIDQVSQPLKSGAVWHLIKVESREEASAQPFETTKGRILSRMTAERRESYGRALSDSLLHYPSTTIFDDSIQAALTPQKTPEDYFKEAQAAVTPLQRIELYKMIAKRFPNEKVTVQAQFMIGFTYAEEMGEYDLARGAFQEFLRLHPDSDLAGSAKWMLDNMGQPGPELDDDEHQEDHGSSAGPDSGKAGPSGTK
jgi:peptidyl-prolyl cis-trans isomerase C